MSDATPSPEPLPRRLSYRPPKARADEIIAQDAVAGLSGPIVILGDPGMGKSFLAKALSCSGSPYVRAGKFHRTADPKTYLPDVGGRLIIDGLDEIASAAPGGGIHDVLRQLSAMGHPPFILLSREADWNGAAARVQIEDDYGAAANLAGGKKGFARALAAQSKPFQDPYAAKAAKQQAKAAEARNAKYETIREDHRKHIEKIREGHFAHLEQDASVYLGRFYEFDKNLHPMERLQHFLGEDLAEDVAEGFMASLDREDRPSAADIATAHAEGRHFRTEVSIVCGIAERLRRGRGLRLPQPTLEAAYMAWRRQHESNIRSGVEIGGPLEAATLTNVTAVERFFRTSIEPQLTTAREHVEDLYKLTNATPWQRLAGRLACEWLMVHPSVSPNVEAELLDCALRYAEPALIGPLLNWSRARVHPTVESLLIWLSADFLVDFDRGRPHLAEAARHEAGLLWRVRSRTLRERHGAWPTLRPAQYAFIVEAFSPLWPCARRPTGTTSGDTNPWDATEFIIGAIFRLAADPTPQATGALVALMFAARSTIAPPAITPISRSQHKEAATWRNWTGRRWW